MRKIKAESWFLLYCQYFKRQSFSSPPCSTFRIKCWSGPVLPFCYVWSLLTSLNFLQTLRELLGPAYHDMKLIPPNLVTELDPVKDIDEKYKDHMFSIQSLLPGYGELAEIACQTDDHVMCETACQTTNPAASLVTTGTQWNEKDFLPDPQAIAEEHAYCKKMKFEVACQVQTLTFSDSSVTANSRKTVQKSLASKNVEKVEKKAKSKTPTVLKLKLRRRKKRW